VCEEDDRAARRWPAEMRRIEGADGPHDGYAEAGRAVSLADLLERNEAYRGGFFVDGDSGWADDAKLSGPDR
jgi:hypothetical protein